ncbi:MAG: 6-bladed beta-propeller [Tannerellaceae bacterium]
MKITNVSAIILLIIMSGCGKANKNLSDDCITVNVSKDYPKKELILQDVMDVEYVALETTDEFITHGDVMDIGEKFILVKNSINDGNLFIFDRKTGKAIRKINRLGQGVEEYPWIGGITLDEDNNELFVKHTSKISVYDLDGRFKRSFKFVDAESDYLKVYNYDRDNLITCDNKGYGMIPDKKPCHLIVSKLDGSIVREIATPSERYNTLVIYGENDEKIIPIFDLTTCFSDSWVLMNLSSDTLYTYMPNGHIKPFIVRTPSIYSMNTEKFLFVDGGTSRYCFMRTMDKKLDIETKKILVSRLVYDKQEDAIFEYEIYNADFVNERPIYWISSINQDIANWYPFDALELVEAYKGGNLKGRLNEIAAGLDEDSNPVIMVIKHKK